jgi:hypothetical protein
MLDVDFWGIVVRSVQFIRGARASEAYLAFQTIIAVVDPYLVDVHRPAFLGIFSRQVFGRVNWQYVIWVQIRVIHSTLCELEWEEHPLLLADIAVNVIILPVSRPPRQGGWILLQRPCLVGEIVLKNEWEAFLYALRIDA